MFNLPFDYTVDRTYENIFNGTRVEGVALIVRNNDWSDCVTYRYSRDIDQYNDVNCYTGNYDMEHRDALTDFVNRSGLPRG